MDILDSDKYLKDYCDMSREEKVDFHNESSDNTLLIMILNELQRIRKITR